MSDSTRSHFALLMRLCKWLKCLCRIGAISYGYTRYCITERHSLASQPSVFVYMLFLVPLNPLQLPHSKTNTVLTVWSSPAFLAWYTAFLSSTTLYFCCIISHPYSKASWDHGIRVTRFTRAQLKRIVPLLSRKLYRIIYKRVRVRCTTTAHGLWIHARVHRVAWGNGVTVCFPWCWRQGSFLSTHLLYKFLSLQLSSLNLFTREGFGLR